MCEITNLTEDDVFILKNWNKIQKIIRIKPINVKSMKRVINQIKTRKCK